MIESHVYPPGFGGQHRAPLAVLSDRHAEILGELEAIFLEDGFRKPTIEALAATAKCSRRTLYEIAPTKGEMFLRVVDRIMGRLDQTAQKALNSGADPVSKIEKILSSSVTAFHPAGGAFATDLVGYEPARLLFNHYTERLRGSLIRIVRQGVASGALRDVEPDVVAEVIIVVSRQVTHPDFLSRTGMSPADALAALFNFLRRGFLPGTDLPPDLQNHYVGVPFTEGEQQ